MASTIPSVFKTDLSPLAFMHLMEKLKHLPRTGWLRTVDNPESVASHSFRLALIGLCAPSPLNSDKCILIGLCHDLAEAIVGDIPTYAGVPKEEKHKLEQLGFEYIKELLRFYDLEVANKIYDAWVEYEDGSSAEARWMREMDKLECLIQAHEYEQRTFGDKDLEEFQGLCTKINSPQGKTWLDLLQQERRAHLTRRKQRLPVILLIGDRDTCERQCALLPEECGFQHVSLDHILVEKSKDNAFPHADFLARCLKENVDAPLDLVIKILEIVIEENAAKGRWTLIYGFPTSTEQLVEFERRFQIPEYIVLLSQSGKDACSISLKDSLISMGRKFKELYDDEQSSDVNVHVQEAVQWLMQQEELTPRS